MNENSVGRLGMDDHNGTHVLEVKGRKSGAWHATPVRLLELDSRRYLVAIYGETDWVYNFGVQGCGRVWFNNNGRPLQTGITSPEDIQ